MGDAETKGINSDDYGSIAAIIFMKTFDVIPKGAARLRVYN